MTTQEIINGLQNILDYCRYHQDAPALREAIEMLKCSEIPNSSDERTDKRTGTHACDCISRQQAIDWCLEGLNNMPSEQPEPCNSCKHNDVADDVICLRCPAERREDE